MRTRAYSSVHGRTAKDDRAQDHWPAILRSAFIGALLVGFTVIGSSCTGASESPAPAQPPKGTAPAKGSDQGQRLFWEPLSCVDKWEFPNQGLDRTIKITVSANNTSGELPYKVEVDFPCAQVKNKGLLQFVLDPNLPADWNTTNSVEVDFVVAKNQGHPMNGPFDKRNGKPKKRGRYEDIAREGTIDPNSMNLKAHKFSEFGYSIRVWDKSLDLVLGEKDPGIMVIENP